MSGHNKWSKIKRQKEKTDGQKSKIFGKMVKMISVEAKKANGNVSSPGLKAAIEKAKSFNVPNDNIERAIKKSAEAKEMELVVYEAYGPGGCAMIIESLTDSKNRANHQTFPFPKKTVKNSALLSMNLKRAMMYRKSLLMRTK